ncbi:MAG: response regulator transcription factor [Clostridiales bacterium]|jgi:DNA-binding NarL/FixJ family response regulator|nr:response regulator transcription factor [Clostridiales bacterium]
MKADANPVKVLIAHNTEQTLKKLIRIVENNPRMVLAGYAKNGYEAVVNAAGGAPDVVVMDIEMESRLAGLYAMQGILKLRPETKVIIYTQHNSGYYVSKAFQFGASDYLIKGISDQDIADAILCASQNRSAIHHEAAEFLRKEFIQLKNAQENLAYTMRVCISLTPSELDILRMLHTGMNYREIAKVRFIEMTTMKTHISNLLRKFGRKSIAEVLETIESTSFFLLIDEVTEDPCQPSPGRDPNGRP